MSRSGLLTLLIGLAFLLVGPVTWQTAGESSKEPAAENKREMLIKVVDTDGKPIAGAKVFRNHRFVEADSVKNVIENENYFTDAKGEAVVNLSGKSVDLRLWVSKRGYVPLHAMWAIELQSDGDQIPETFEFPMERGTKIGGVVTNVAGIPISGVKVNVVDATASQFHTITTPPKPARRPVRDQYLSEGAAVVTNSEGEWELENVPPDDALVFNQKSETASDAPLRLRFSHPDYETIEGIEDYQTIWNPPLESLRTGTAHTVMKWVNSDNPGRVNAVRLAQGEQYRRADFSGRHFKAQELMVWSGDMLAGANLTDSTWEDMLIPGHSGLLDGADLTRARLLNAQLVSMKGGLQETRFDSAVLESANLKGGESSFQKANFDDATMTNSDLTGEGAAFQMASFRGTKLHSSKLTGTGPAFQQANLDDAKLVKTAIVCDSPTAFQGVSLNDTDFYECDLTSIDARALESCKFDAKTPPRYDSATKFPEGFDPKEHGWKLIE